MKEWEGLWFPDSETHLIDWMRTNRRYVDGKPTYQYAKYEKALRLLPQDRRRVAIDVGANVGLWSRVMALDFEQVAAFEPMPEYSECLRRNAPTAQHELVALGAGPGRALLANTTAGSCGDTRVVASETGLTQVEALDSFWIDKVDLIKIDCEGYEQYVCEGARETLLHNRPVVIVEQKPGHASKAYGLHDQGALRFLQGLGMKLHAEMSGDFILGW